MRRLLQILAVAAISCISSVTFAQVNTEELLRGIEASNRSAQLEMEKSRLRLHQMDVEAALQYAEIERLRIKNESEDASIRAEEVAERLEQVALDQAEAAKQAGEATEALLDEIEQTAVRTRNHTYLGIFILAIIGFAWHVVRGLKHEDLMKENQKFGIVTVICSILLMLFVVMISEDWLYRVDFLQNLMTSLKIKLFAEDDCTGSYCSYVVNLPTKYVVLACLGSSSYGFTTYLGITPTPNLKDFVSDKGDAT
ncbi:MAG: hypothetical protein BVN35_19890 [Proteobacteria bacterium ST_bin11]|nr:MAG: hypothetical protein BVN35_19890 [Proteobacteria bacterium ST_bin11]